jgi:hypothetical protein
MRFAACGGFLRAVARLNCQPGGRFAGHEENGLTFPHGNLSVCS